MGRGKANAVHIPVREHVLRQIRSGELAGGAPIETEERLASLFGISRCSVRTALRELTEQGYLRKIQGKGTFVTSAEQRLCKDGQPVSNLRTLILLGKGEAPSSISGYHREFIRGIASEACERGHKLIYATPPADFDTLLKMYEDEGCGGVIWLRTKPDLQPLVREFDARGVPQVLINRTMDGIPSVCADEETGFSEIVSFLAGIGHSRIALLNSDENEPLFLNRAAYFMKCMEKAGLSSNAILLRTPAQEAAKTLETAFESGSLPDALIVGGQHLLLNALPWLSARRIPEELSVVCYNDSPEAISFKTPISAYSDAKEEIGRKAMELLEASAAGRTKKGERKLVRGSLVARASCALPKRLKNAIEQKRRDSI